MRKLMLAAGLAAALGVPAVTGVASAHPRHHHRYVRHCRYERHRNTAFGAIAGTVGGGILGSVLSHGHAGGTLLGAGAGALTGSTLARNSTRC
ncbi:MAG TPA: hypothetical protein VHW60_15945 [Caulobacteraceae bacterium]|jgi:hypothetical protein|nr:hypothetical protein [Caulobacteraceae bacterium]